VRYWHEGVDEDFSREQERAAREGQSPPASMTAVERIGRWALIACPVLLLLAALDSVIPHSIGQ